MIIKTLGSLPFKMGGGGNAYTKCHKHEKNHTTKIMRAIKNPNIYFLPYIYFKTKNIYGKQREIRSNMVFHYTCASIFLVSCVPFTLVINSKGNIAHCTLTFYFHFNSRYKNLNNTP